MAKLKTKTTEIKVTDFLDAVEDEQKRKDAYELMDMMGKATKEPAKMWGASIVGFGKYHYKYESGHEGDMCLIGFSPRKPNLVLYMGGKNEALLEKLGKYKPSKGCLYIKKLADVDKTVLKQLIKESVAYMKKTYPGS